MIALAVAVLAITVQQPPTRPDSVPRDTARTPRIGAAAGVTDSTKPRNVTVGMGLRARGREIPLTDELRANAYRDPQARALVARARAARTNQDSLLQSYDAHSVERVSVGARVKATGRDRLAMRGESATRIQWQRGVGAHIEIEGSRFVVPMASSKVEPEYGSMLGGPSSIPYYPGREALWPMGDTRAVTNSENGIWRHPLGASAEAYYRYATGDSISFRLGEGRTIQLREIRLEPREPRSDLVAGSFWFDTESAQLVRAVYRPAIPLDIQANFGTGDSGSSAPRWLRPLIMTIRAVSVEFGLHEGRWWLPRRHAVEGEAQVTFIRVPITVDQRFTYASVDGSTTLPPIAVSQPDSLIEPRRARGDSAWRALPYEERQRLMEAAEEERDRRRKEACATAGFTTRTTLRDSVPVQIRVPCDSATLINSPALPASIFEETDDPLEEADRRLVDRALGWASQADWALGALKFAYGLDLVRYNRVEGLSVGALVSEELGKGFAASLLGRIGVADLHPRGELTLSRSDAFRTVSLSGYERLGVANDWGAPLDFGASLNALLFGRDEGLYYGARGVELTGLGVEGPRFSWRLFAEQNRAVDVETNFSIPNLINGYRFRENVAADRADLLGAGIRLHGSRGDNPASFRLLADVRVEGATGDFDFGRGMVDATISRPLVARFDASLTGAGGSSVGTLPSQRLWYLGGVHTVRGQPLAAAAGNAFWMGRAELGYGNPLIRPSVFYDLGWAGNRASWRDQGRPISGAGVGVSVLDGLLRLDAAAGIRPSRGVRVDLTLEARF